MAKKTINITAICDIPLTNLGISNTSSWLKENVTYSGDTLLTTTLSADTNSTLSARTAYISASGISGTVSIQTPNITILQNRKPYVYQLNNTILTNLATNESGERLLINEEGTKIRVSTNAAREDNLSATTYNSNYFQLTTSGSCVQTIAKAKSEEDNRVIWEFNVANNPTTSARTMSYMVNFNNYLNSTDTKTLSLTQLAHEPIYSNPTLKAYITTIPAEGGNYNIDSYCYIDGVKTQLDNIQISSASTFSNATITSSGITSTIYFSGNTNVTETGDPSGYTIVEASYNDEILSTEKIYQKTQKSNDYEFSFGDGKRTKKILIPYSSEEQLINISIISNKADSLIEDVTLVSNDNATLVSYNSGNATVLINKNITNSSREIVLTFQQGNNSPMPNILMRISQLCESDETNGAMANGDYIIFNSGIDFMSGDESKFTLWMINHPDSYDNYQYIGNDGKDFLEIKYPNSSYEFTNTGDDVNLSFTWIESTSMVKSFVIKPKYLISEDFAIEDMAKNDYFNIRIYGKIANTPYNSGTTLNFTCYSDATENVSRISTEFGDIFKASANANVISEKIYHLKVGTKNNTPSGGIEGCYYLLGYLRFTYATCTWDFVEYDSYKEYPTTESEKSLVDISLYNKDFTYDNIKQLGSNFLYNDKVYGRFLNKTNDSSVNFSTLGTGNYTYLDLTKNTGYNLYSFTPIYDRTKCQITKVGVGASDSSVEWKDLGNEAMSVEWSVNNTLEDDKFYVYVAPVASNSPTKTTIQRTVHNAVLNGNPESAITTSALSGVFYDEDNSASTTFNITSGTTAYRTISWQDTTNGTNLSTAKLVIKSLSGYDNEEYKLQGIKAYSSTVLPNSEDDAGLSLSNFTYLYNSGANKLQLIWGKDTTYTNTIKVYVVGLNIPLTHRIEYILSSTTTTPAEYESTVINYTSQSQSREYAGSITVTSTNNKDYIHVKLTTTVDGVEKTIIGYSLFLNNNGVIFAIPGYGITWFNE